jgi:RNA polymerase sigma factor (sigma-70 family)
MTTSAFLQSLVRQLRQTAEAGQLADCSDAELLERFQSSRDAEAFEAIVRRYGACVLSACRKVLGSTPDVEDAFQATFLVLLQNGTTIRQRQALGGWLTGVAHRIALKALAEKSRRRARERKPAAAEEGPDLSWREACAILHEELDRLPDTYRLPLLLCYLEGRSRDEAAQQLGCNLGVLHGRLERGRDRLRTRLTKRGVTLSTGLLAALANSVTAGGPPESLLRATLAAATTGRIPASVAALLHGAAPSMTLGKWKLLAVAILMLGLISGGIGLRMHAEPAVSANTEAKGLVPAPDPDKPGEAAKPPAEKDTIAYSGRVLGPDGKPVVGARLYLTPWRGYSREAYQATEYGTTGPDGRFEFNVPKAKFGDGWTVVGATAANSGVGWVPVRPAGKRDDLTIRLVVDDVPITGQIVDLEGKPIAGVTLRVKQVNAAPDEDLGPWVEAARGKKGLSMQLQRKYLPSYTVALSLQVTTDSSGRFRLTGIGRNRLVIAQLEGPTIVSQELHILTRPGEPITVTEYESRPEYQEPRTVATYYGADFRFPAAPTRPIVGVVRDKDTKKPLAGATVRSYSVEVNPSQFRILDSVQTTTDTEGRYRLTGMPKGKGYSIAVVPTRDQPYVVAQKAVTDDPGLDPVTVDVELKRGVWIEGRITDKVTGKPLKGSVEYFSLYSNPNLQEYAGFDGTFVRSHSGVAAKEDGSYRVVGLPGPGALGVYYQHEPYLRAPERDDEFGIKEESLSTAPYHLLHPVNYSALARIDPPRGADTVKRDITLDPGWMFQGTVLDPDGKPLAGARRFDLNGQRWWANERMTTAEFTGGFNPRHPGENLFLHPEKGLVGVATPPKENGGSVAVRMEPGASVTGRLVDGDGKPRVGVELEMSFRPKNWGAWIDYFPERIKTDREGRFRIEMLVPGYEFRLSDDMGEVLFGGGLRSGQTKDLGDVRLKQKEE